MVIIQKEFRGHFAKIRKIFLGLFFSFLFFDIGLHTSTFSLFKKRKVSFTGEGRVIISVDQAAVGAAVWDSVSTPRDAVALRGRLIARSWPITL